MPRADAVMPVFQPDEGVALRAARATLACPSVDRLIVIDDGSQPPVREWELGPRLVWIRQPNAGPSAARNRGLELVRADFALLVDHDDEPIADGVEAMIRLAGRIPRAAAVVAARVEVGPRGELLKPAPEAWADRPLPDPGMVFSPLSIFGASGCMVSRQVLEAGVRFDPRFAIGEDRDFLRRAAAHGPILVSSRPAMRVRLHEHGSNLTSASRLSRRIRDHVLLLETHLDESTRPHLWGMTRWLLGAASKARVPDDDWRILVAAVRRAGWRVPLKPRLRRRILRP